MRPRGKGVGFSHESIAMVLGARLCQRIVHTLVLNGLLFHYGCRRPTINQQKLWSADVFRLFYCSPYLGPKGAVGSHPTSHLGRRIMLDRVQHAILRQRAMLERVAHSILCQITMLDRIQHMFLA